MCRGMGSCSAGLDPSLGFGIIIIIYGYFRNGSSPIGRNGTFSSPDPSEIPCPRDSKIPGTNTPKSAPRGSTSPPSRPQEVPHGHRLGPKSAPCGPACDQWPTIPGRQTVCHWIGQSAMAPWNHKCGDNCPTIRPSPPSDCQTIRPSDAITHGWPKLAVGQN